MSFLETERLVLRPWREEDAAALFKYARDPAVGPAAGWPVHKDEADSLNILRTVLMKENTWAVTIKGSDEPVGSIGYFPSDGSADHVGLVIGRDEGRVYTVEGNSGDACKIKSYPLDYACIKGYGLMNWN